MPANPARVPQQFTNLGYGLALDRVVVLTGAAVGLTLLYHANVNSLIHLYVVGVFTAFTLSQTGMVRYWFRALRTTMAVLRVLGQRVPRDDKQGSSFFLVWSEVHRGCHGS